MTDVIRGGRQEPLLPGVTARPPRPPRYSEGTFSTQPPPTHADYREAIEYLEKQVRQAARDLQTAEGLLRALVKAIEDRSGRVGEAGILTYDARAFLARHSAEAPDGK